MPHTIRLRPGSELRACGGVVQGVPENGHKRGKMLAVRTRSNFHFAADAKREDIGIEGGVNRPYGRAAGTSGNEGRGMGAQVAVVRLPHFRDAVSFAPRCRWVALRSSVLVFTAFFWLLGSVRLPGTRVASNLSLIHI